MYHYYVRYSGFANGEKIVDGDSEITTIQEVSQMSDIEKFKVCILEGIKKEEKIQTVDAILIDFYALLRKDNG